MIEALEGLAPQTRLLNKSLYFRISGRIESRCQLTIDFYLKIKNNNFNFQLFPLFICFLSLIVVHRPSLYLYLLFLFWLRILLLSLIFLPEVLLSSIPSHIIFSLLSYRTTFPRLLYVLTSTSSLSRRLLSIFFSLVQLPSAFNLIFAISLRSNSSEFLNESPVEMTEETVALSVSHEYFSLVEFSRWQENQIDDAKV